MRDAESIPHAATGPHHVVHTIGALAYTRVAGYPVNFPANLRHQHRFSSSHLAPFHPVLTGSKKDPFHPVTSEKAENIAGFTTLTLRFFLSTGELRSGRGVEADKRFRFGRFGEHGGGAECCGNEEEFHFWDFVG